MITTQSPPVLSATQTSGNPGPTDGRGHEVLSRGSAPGADGTSTRVKPRHPRKAVVGPTLKQDVAVLKASGMSVSSIAKTLGKRRQVIQVVQSLPEVRASIEELRRTWKHDSQAKVTQLSDKTWNLVEEFVDSKDSKQLDNTMRAVAAMEKVSASVSGEGHKVEVSGMIEGPPSVELKSIVYQIFGQRPPGD